MYDVLCNFSKFYPSPSNVWIFTELLLKGVKCVILYIENRDMSRNRVQFSLIYNEVARRLLLKQELGEIAQAMCIREESLKTMMLRPAFKELLAELQKTIYRPIDQGLVSDARNLREELQGAAFTSFDRLLALQKSAASEQVIMNISQDLLDRAGYAKTSKIIEERTVRIDPLDAEVLVSALAREKEGREHLSTKSVDDLLGSGKQSVKHPNKPAA